MLDIYGFRVIVGDVPSCYLALGALHSMYTPVPGKFKDYLAIPKANGYQSLHTTLIGPRHAGRGADPHPRDAPHRRDRRGLALAVQGRREDPHRAAAEDALLAAVLLELQSDSGEATEFLEHVKIDLFPGEVYVLAQGQDLLGSMPAGSTVDFCLRGAYRRRQTAALPAASTAT